MEAYNWFPELPANFWYYIWAVCLLLANSTACLSTLFLLPGNWMILAQSAVFAWLARMSDGGGVSLGVIVAAAVLAGLGEVLEAVGGAAGAIKQGASRRSIVLALVGAVIASVLGAGVGIPIPVIGPVIGAFVGGCLGAFGGAYLGEIGVGRSMREAAVVGSSAFVGRLWGTAAKVGVGGVMVVVITIDSFV